MPWPTKKLGEIAEVVMGQSPPSSSYNEQGNGLPFFQGKAEFGEIYPTPVKYCSSPSRIAEADDILISVRAPVGNINIAKEKSCVGRGLGALRAKKDILDQMFLFYFMKKNENNWSRLSTGSTFSAIKGSNLRNFEVPVPPLATQKQIVERLDKIAEAQKLNDELIQKTDELFRSLLHKELNPIRDSKHSNGVNPAGKDWSTKRLKEICEINPSKAKINKLSANISVGFLAMADVSESAEITNRQEKKISEVKNGFTFFEDGDVLVAKITPCFENGKGALVENMKNGIGFGSTEFHVLRSNSKILLNQFLYYLVSDKKFRKIGAKFMTGSAGQRRVPKQYLENHKITLPPLETQKKIVAKLSAVQDYKKQLLQQKSKLKELFDSSLSKSMKN